MDDAARKEFAVGCYQRCWELLDAGTRTPDEEVELLTAAFTARHHWEPIGGPEQWILSDWMVSRAAAAVGEGGLALRFAERAYGACLAEGTADWLLASAAEGVARAFAAAGDEVECAAWIGVAEGLVRRITDDDDRALVADQLSELRHR